MNAKIASVLVLAAAAGTVSFAQSAQAFQEIDARKFALDLYDQQAREQMARQHATTPQAAAVSPLAAVNFDADHDGKLDAKEMAAWQKAVRAAAEKSPRCLAEFDKNHDGKLDDAEWAACWEALIAPPVKK